MNPEDKIKELISKSDIATDAQTENRILGDALKHLDILKQKSPRIGLYIWRIIMKSPITKLAAAAVIAVAVLICINQFNGSGTSLAWGEVAKKVEASRGLIYRERTLHSGEFEEGTYIMFYVSPTHARMDTYKENEVTRSIYCNCAPREMLIVQHSDKIYTHIPMDDRDVQDHQRELNLKGWVKEILSRQHTNIGRRTIGGVLCEGLETKYPIFGDMDAPAGNSARRVWVSVETEYPLLCEGGTLGDDGKLRVEAVLDQFQWDVELDDGEFEPNIPPDYEQM